MANIRELQDTLIEKIIKLLEGGVADWSKVWKHPNVCNGVTGRKYNGCNFISLTLYLAEHQELSDDPRFVTFKQAQEKKWHVKQGSKGIPILFFKRDYKRVEDEDGKTTLQEKSFVRTTYVFHASQIEGISPFTREQSKAERIEKAERVIQDSGAKIVHGMDRAGYSPMIDTIVLPNRADFFDAEGYYSTALHELVHWTGGHERLNRPQIMDKNTIAYAREEFIAEWGAVFLTSELGIEMSDEHFANHTAYFQSWNQLLKANPNDFLPIIKEAQKAVDFLADKERKRQGNANG